MKHEIFNFRHLKEENVSYSKHFIRSLNISCKMFLGCLAGVVHALLPFLLCRYNTNNIKEMSKRIKE